MKQTTTDTKLTLNVRRRRIEIRTNVNTGSVVTGVTNRNCPPPPPTSAISEW